MAYIVKADLKGLIPEEFLNAALDDDGAACADAGTWDAVADAVEDEINGRLAQTFAVPISPVPEVLKAAARAIAAYVLYQRRAVADEANPWSDQAKYWRDKLDSIGSGEEPLTYEAGRAKAPAVLIEEPARTHSAQGALLV